MWKIACALAIMSGHILVTLHALHPASGTWPTLLSFLKFFGSRHFFFFSGFFAARGLVDDRPIAKFAATRFARLYVLVLASVSLGVLARFAFTVSGLPDTVDPWPNGLWQGPIDWTSALRHLLPTGLVATNDFNYAIWYLYHELRLVLLFPLFRWALRGGWIRSVGTIALLLAVAVAGEHRYFGAFPLFRTSPFQTLGYGFVFLVGAATWKLQTELSERGIRPSRAAAAILLCAGLLVAYLEALGIQPQVHNPPILNVQTAAGQAMVFLALCWLLPDLTVPGWLRRATYWSVGIYVVHPPVHQLICHWIAWSHNDLALALVPLISIPLGALFFHGFVQPVGKLLSPTRGDSG